MKNWEQYLYVYVYVLHFTWAEKHDNSELEMSVKVRLIYNVIFSLQ